MGPTYRWLIPLLIALGVACPRTALYAQADGCVGDCDGDAAVTQSDLIIALGDALEESGGALCDSLDVGPQDGRITVEEIVVGTDAVGSCPTGSETATPTQTATITELATGTQTATPSPSASTGVTPIAQAIERDANGIALHAGETLTTEGVATVAAGVLQNVLKIFLQDGAAGIEVFNERAGDFPTFQAGDRLRVSGLISQDPDPARTNRALGTVAVVIGKTSWRLISPGNPLPEPIVVNLETLVANGNAYTGSVVRVNSVHKVDGEWPVAGQENTQVTIADTTESTILLRLQRHTISTELANKLAAIGNSPFDLVSIAAQNDLDGNQTFLSGYELWIRGADDVLPLN